jgi:AcrR family transcriptional regulator
MAKKASNTEENRRVRKAISEALFDLLLEKDFSEITVTDIIKKAGVARASYYRNYDSKEDVLKESMKELQRKVTSDIEPSLVEGDIDHDTRVRLLEEMLTVFLSMKSYILSLHKTGYSMIFLDYLNDFSISMFGVMPRKSIERYGVYYAAGGIFNVMIIWLENGAVETPHAVAEYCIDAMEK